MTSDRIKARWRPVRPPQKVRIVQHRTISNTVKQLQLHVCVDWLTLDTCTLAQRWRTVAYSYTAHSYCHTTAVKSTRETILLISLIQTRSVLVLVQTHDPTKCLH